MNQRLINSHAFAMAQELLALVGPCLREEERRDAFDEFFSLCKRWLQSLCLHEQQIQKRLRPMEN